MTDKPKPRRRWLQFSLRTLFIVVTVFCVWLGFVVSKAREQRLAVEAIRAVGGYVSYNYQYSAQVGVLGWPKVLGNPPPPLPGPVWLRKLIGTEYFSIATEVWLSGQRTNDIPFSAIQRLRKLTGLTIHDTKITDTELEHLQGLASLKTLYFVNVEISDEGIKKLEAALPNCEIIKYESPS